jgi:hypothetical protein
MLGICCIGDDDVDGIIGDEGIDWGSGIVGKLGIEPGGPPCRIPLDQCYKTFLLCNLPMDPVS